MHVINASAYLRENENESAKKSRNKQEDRKIKKIKKKECHMVHVVSTWVMYFMRVSR